MFAAMGVLLLAGISVINKKLILDKLYAPQNVVLSRETNLIIIGDSSLEYSYNPAIIKNSINNARPAENYFYSYYKLKFILEKNKHVKTVVLGYGYHNLSKNRDADIMPSKMSLQFYNRYFMLLDATGRKEIQKLDMNYLFCYAKFCLGIPLEFYKNMDLIVDLLLGKFDHTKYPFWGDFSKDKKLRLNVAFEKMLDAEVVGSFYNGNTIAGKSPVMSAYLVKIAELCSRNNIQLILLATPVHKDYLSRVPPYYMELNSEMLVFLKKRYPDIRYYDYSSLLTDDSFFLDPGHLNHRGADIFTAELKLKISQEHCCGRS